MTQVKAKTQTKSQTEAQTKTNNPSEVDSSVFIAPTVTERARLAKTLRKTPVGAIPSGLQNRLIQVLEYDAGMTCKPVSSIYGQPAGPLGESPLAPQGLRPEDCVINVRTGEER